MAFNLLAKVLGTIGYQNLGRAYDPSYQRKTLHKERRLSGCSWAIHRCFNTHPYVATPIISAHLLLKKEQTVLRLMMLPSRLRWYDGSFGGYRRSVFWFTYVLSLVPLVHHLLRLVTSTGPLIFSLSHGTAIR